MKKLIFLAIVAIAAWQLWKHHSDLSELFQRRPSHQAVVENATGEVVQHLRLIVGDQTFVRDELPAGDRAVFPFRVSEDATFRLTWSQGGRQDERQWSGGRVVAGPLVARHLMTLQDDGGVIYRAEPLSSASP